MGSPSPGLFRGLGAQHQPRPSAASRRPPSRICSPLWFTRMLTAFFLVTYRHLLMVLYLQPCRNGVDNLAPELSSKKVSPQDINVLNRSLSGSGMSILSWILSIFCAGKAFRPLFLRQSNKIITNWGQSFIKVVPRKISLEHYFIQARY